MDAFNDSMACAELRAKELLEVCRIEKKKSKGLWWGNWRTLRLLTKYEPVTVFSILREVSKIETEKLASNSRFS